MIRIKGLMIFLLTICMIGFSSCERKSQDENNLYDIDLDNLFFENNVFYFLIEVNNKSKRDVYFKKGYENNKNFPGVYDSFFYLEYQQKQIPLYTSIESEVLIKKGTAPIFVFFYKREFFRIRC